MNLHGTEKENAPGRKRTGQKSNCTGEDDAIMHEDNKTHGNKELRSDNRCIKCFYAEYVNHMLRFFCRYPKIAPDDIMTDADRKNWHVCKTVFDNIESQNADIIRELYVSRDVNFNNAGAQLAVKYGMPEKHIWRLVRTVREQIARERGLI